MADAQTAREVQALPGPAEAEVRAASVGTTATLTEALRQWAQGQPRRGTVPAEGAAAAAALGEQVGPILALHLPRAEALATAHVGRQLGAVSGVAPITTDTAGVGEHLAGRAREILAAELGRAYLRGLEHFDPAAVAQQVVRRVVAAAVLAVRTELMRAYNATARALLDAAGRWRIWDAQLDTACARCDALDGQIAEPGRPFFLEGAPVGDPPLHPHCRCKLVPAHALELELSEPDQSRAITSVGLTDLQQEEARQASGEGVTRAELDEWLRANPLSRTVFAASFPLPGVDPALAGSTGGYDPITATMYILTRRPPGTWGVADSLGEAATVSATAPTMREAVARSTVHELTHHMVRVARLTDREMARCDWVYWQAVTRNRVMSHRAADDWREYLAELHVAYVYERAVLRVRDPAGYSLVEWLRQRAGVTP